MGVHYTADQLMGSGKKMKKRGFCLSPHVNRIVKYNPVLVIERMNLIDEAI
jgi:hypothetical protein